jgi:hypothetical protein
MTPGSLQFSFQQLTTALSDPTQRDAPFFTVTANSNFPNAETFMGDYSALAVTPTGVDALWTDMRLPSTFRGFSGSGEDAFFADPPVVSSAAAGTEVSAAGLPSSALAGRGTFPAGLATAASSLIDDLLATAVAPPAVAANPPDISYGGALSMPAAQPLVVSSSGDPVSVVSVAVPVSAKLSDVAVDALFGSTDDLLGLIKPI